MSAGCSFSNDASKFYEPIKLISRPNSAVSVPPLDVIVFETLSQSRLHGNVGRTPVRVAADAVHDRLGGFRLQREGLVEGAELQGVLSEPVHGVLLRRHLKHPGSQREISNSHNSVRMDRMKDKNVSND